MLLLAFDTATPAVTVALYADGGATGPGTPGSTSTPGATADQETTARPGEPGRVVAESTEVDARRHGELLLPAVDRVLASVGTRLDQVTDIVVGVGPGPYTGLRVGLVTAVSFGDALGVPVHGLCTLDGIAFAAGQDGPFTVATDARRKEVYWARYADARTRIGEPAVDRPADIADQVAGLPAVGAGALLYPEVFPDARAPEHQSAAALARLAAVRLAEGGEFLPPRPLYLRRPDAQVPAGYKAVLPKAGPSQAAPSRTGLPKAAAPR